MERILLEITGTQQIDDQKDKIELTTMGTIRDDGTAYIVRYKEEQEPPSKPINVTVRIAKDASSVNMTRTGALDSCLLIEKSKRNQCQYRTPFGDVLMGVYGKEVETDVNEDGGKFNFVYDIDINGSVTSMNTLKMIFKKNQEQ